MWVIDQGTRELIGEAIGRARARMVSLAGDLVAKRSVPGAERDIALMCAGHLDRLGFSVDVWEPCSADLAGYGYDDAPARLPLEGRPNVVGVLRGRGNGRSLCLNAHLDVVPPGDESLWRHPPWQATFTEGRIYGRGACDTKGGLASVLTALEVMRELDLSLAGNVLVELVVDEESGGRGTMASIARGYRADGCLVVEPFGVDRIAVGHRGSLSFRIGVTSPPLGLSERGAAGAVEMVSRVVSSVETLRELRRESSSRAWGADVFPAPPVYLGVIRSGDWFSSVPTRGVIEGVAGWLPGEDLDSVKEEIRGHFLGLAAGDASTCGIDVTFPLPWIHPCVVGQSHPFVAAVREAVSAVTGRRPDPFLANSGSDQSARVVYGDTPTVMCGPAGGNAHCPDEYVLVDEMVAFSGAVAMLAVGWCGCG